MPIIPTVFRPIRSSDVHQRTFKSYKNYHVTSTGFATSSGYVHHQGIYKAPRIHVGDLSYNYPTNSLDKTNKHVIWHSLNHRYYGYPYDPAKSTELTNASITSKNLYQSASALIAPYFRVGEKIKPGSVIGTFTHGLDSYTLQDDNNGNLRDNAILTSSFASSSRNIFYMSFNKEFENNSPIESQYATRNFSIDNGVQMTGNKSSIYSGHSFVGGNDLIGGASIRIPHESKFNRFNHPDDWTISFWHNNSFAGLNHPIITKAGIRKETYFDSINNMTRTRDNVRSMPNITSSYDKIRSPFIIGVNGEGIAATSASWNFQSSNGSSALHISSSAADSVTDTNWSHVCIRHSASLCQIFVNGNTSGTSGSLPAGITANNDDVIIGSFISGSQNLPNTLNHIAEIRMYDYAVSTTEISSLANRHYISGSLFQTNIAGNVFYRNGEMVISSPMVKYNTGSGAFSNIFDVSYKGTHTIYENEVLVRVPSDQFNVSMNPSATYTPATNKLLSQAEQSNALPGVLRKSMFVSGTATPYITTIGLYNDAAQLVAVSKTAQPIQKRSDVDMNFIIRWDI